MAMASRVGKLAVGSLRVLKSRPESVRRLVHQAIAQGHLNRSSRILRSANGRIRGACTTGPSLRRIPSRVKSTSSRKESTTVTVQPTSLQASVFCPPVKDQTVPEGRVLTTRGKLHMNFDDVNFNDVKSNAFMDELKKGLQRQLSMHSPNSVSLNNIPERFYMNDLKRFMKRQGFSGIFSRYNHDTGKAVFNKSKVKDPQTSALSKCAVSYFKSVMPNPV